MMACEADASLPALLSQREAHQRHLCNHYMPCEYLGEIWEEFWPPMGLIASRETHLQPAQPCGIDKRYI